MSRPQRGSCCQCTARAVKCVASALVALIVLHNTVSSGRGPRVELSSGKYLQGEHIPFDVGSTISDQDTE